MKITRAAVASSVLLVLVAVACGGATPEPAGPNRCQQDAKVCPDGTTVTRSGPDCTFPPCASPAAGPAQCHRDAKICPDGSTVGRTGPDCSFAPCPGQKP